jgi:hypothetical protein
MRALVAALAAALFLSVAFTSAYAATTSCATVAACIFGSNTRSGYGVEGSSKANDGVVGITTQNATSPSTGKAGVSGYDSSNNKNPDNSGVYGTSPYGDGVQGKSASGTGVMGISTNGAGVYGMTSNGTGVVGYASSHTNNVGLLGISDTGNGVVGSVDFQYGVYGESADGIGVGALAYHPGAIAVQAVSVSGDLFDGLQLAYGSDTQTMEAAISSNGDMTLAGTLTTNGTPNFRTTDSAGASIVTFGTRSTMATLEDTGEASLANGAAYVRLDPQFARTINPRTKYLVFITPEGNSKGLYTSDATSQGFSVHENDGGRSTLSFAYRIVAHPLDDLRQLRLPSTSVLPHQLIPPRNSPKTPKVPRFAH